MVAKSYQKLEVVSEVYHANGRAYVKVRDGQGNIKQVRWYTDKEYLKMYGELPDTPAEGKRIRSQKDVLGFKEGYITIFKGDTYPYKDDLSDAGARYTRLWGWGIPGGEPVPEFPGIEPVRLEWDLISRNENGLKTDAEVQEVVDSLIYDESPSEYVGTVGERLRGIFVKVIAATTIDSYFGQSTAHDFEDEDGNIYTWITSAKSLPEGNTYWLDGTIKEHKMYKGVKKTILTRCRVAEEIC